MTLLIVSDTHGRVDKLTRLFEMHKNVDALMFLGDGLADLNRAGAQEHSFTVFSVKGNCDAFSLLSNSRRIEEEITFSFDGIKFFALHGHTRHVKSSLTNAIYAADEREADVLLFGHTHIPTLTYISGEEYNLSRPVYVFNPGSLASNSYGLCEIRKGQVLLSHGTLD